ncbi:hypothetical protein AB1K91_17680 [Terribacillus sp. 179-K 1B1 HS]|uniref:hypothetical protein n=1 Tax=Terribacillus sp. 179-K 1B1 HS TaxID=3142388 RepID=UPI0039A25CEA
MKKYGLIAAALGGLATACLAKFYADARAYETERAAGKFDDDMTESDGNKASGIVWANGQLSSAVSLMIEDAKANGKRTTIDELFGDESGSEREPLFGMNERVTIVNPYESATWVDEDSLPHEYRITDMEFDMQDAVWRYKLEAEGNEDDRWYSEEWLEAPLFTQMTKGESDMQAKGTKKAGAVVTEANRKLQIDYYLADLHEAMAAKDEKRQAEALAELKRLNAAER